ncbi:superoxide dismutase, Ni [Pseudodesulfovibrio sp. zrk46]|uniref:superoxide dismutase, Ni n=1 Tax=Pseudodesulfovibrio sp. zrk46 TaxID=2725288 RepID=UPI001449650F|nr:superoxide dismutase, Ni [Pseudodesulfovibrio sp. zrk46]QJB57534.1 superoxide dismutase [Pseudodesulfovibrio sp. zrk46]
MKKMYSIMIAFGLTLVLAIPRVMAHCQVPCGIYDDNARVASMLEDAITIKKAVSLLNELNSKSDVQSRQQFVRWVNTKEQHAQKIISTISDYFLTQRVKANQDDYVQRLKDHHAVIVGAMKAKQNATDDVASNLEEAIKLLLKYYPEHKH